MDVRAGAAAVSGRRPQYTLYTCMVTSKGLRGRRASCRPAEFFSKPRRGEWRHAGFNHPVHQGARLRSARSRHLYVAAGNGLLRLTDHGERWKILTGSDVTELLDVAVDRNAPGTIYFSHTAASVSLMMAVRPGATPAGPSPQIHEAIRVDSRQARVSCWRATKKAFSAAKTAANPGSPRARRDTRCCTSNNRRMIRATGWPPPRAADCSCPPIAA